MLQLSSRTSFLDYLLLSVIWLQSFPNFLQHIFFFISEIQLIHILLYSQSKLILPDEHSTLKEILTKLLPIQSIDISVVSLSASIHPLMIVTWIYFAIFFVAFGAILNGFHLKKSLSPFEAKFLTLIGQFHLSAGFWFMNMILLDAVSTHTSLLGDISNLVLIVLNHIIGAFFSTFSYHPLIGSTRFSTHTPIFQIQTFLFKAVASIFFNSSLTPWVFSISSLVLLTIRHYSLLSIFPYYEYRPMKAAVVMSAISILISFMSLFALAAKITSENSFLYIEILLLVFFIIIETNRFELILRKYCIASLKGLTSQKEILKKVFALRCLFEKMKVNVYSERKFMSNELIFWGIMESIRKDVSELALYSPNTGVLKNQSGKNTMKEFRKDFVKTRNTIIQVTLKRAIDRFKYTNKLKILMCCLSLQDEIKIDTSIYYLTSMTQMNEHERIIALSLNKQVQIAVNKFFSDSITEEKKLDIKTYMDLESISVKFTQMIYSNSKSSLKFWKNYLKQNPKIKELYRLNTVIENGYHEVNNFWSNNIDPNGVFAKSLSAIYSIYLNLVRNTPNLSKKVSHKCNLSYSNRTQNSDNEGPLSESNLGSSYNITIYASISQENLGTILYVSPNSTDLLGWRQNDLKGTNINVLMPSVMHKGHGLMLAQHLKNVSDGFSSKRLYKNVATFVRDKDGFIIPCYIYLSIYPYVQKELVYASMMRLKKSKSDVILVNQKGSVEGFTKGIGEILDLRVNKTCNMSDICENYKLFEDALDNLHHQSTAKTGSKVNEKGLATLGNVMPTQTKGSSDGRTLNIQLRFRLSNRGSIKFLDATKTFSVKITMQQIWGYSFFALKIFINANKESSLQEREVMSLRIPGERKRTFEEHLPSPTNTPSQNTGTSQILSKETTTKVTKGQKAIMMSKKSDPMEYPLFPIKSYGPSKRFDHNTESAGVLEPTESAQQNSNICIKIRKEKGNNKQALKIENIGSYSSSISLNKYDPMLEKAVYDTPKSQRLGTVKFLTLLFLVGTLVIFIMFLVKNDRVLSNQKQSFEIVDESLELLEKICDMNRALRLLKIFTSEKLLNMKVGETSRYEILNAGISVSPIKTQVEILRNRAQEANEINNNLRACLYDIDEGVQKRFYDNYIPVLDIDDRGIAKQGRAFNIFDMVTKITATASKLSLECILDSEVDLNPSFMFILSNTLGSILTVGENISFLLKSDQETKSGDLRDFLVICIGLMSAFSVIILFLFMKFIFLFMRKRDQLIEIIQKLNTSDIEKHAEWMRKFITIIEESNMDCKRINKKMNRFNLPNFVCKSNKEVKSSKKIIDNKGINIILIVTCLAKFCLIFLILSAYMVILKETKNQIEVSNTNVNLIITSNSYLYQFNLLSTIIYEYIDQNKTTQVRNNPIKQEWDYLKNNISEAQNSIFSTFLEEQDATADQLPLKMISMYDLCNQLELEQDEDIALCNQIAGGTLKKGTIGFVNYGLATLELAKMTFDESKMTEQNKRNVLEMKDFVTFEAMMNIFGSKIFRKFMMTLRNHVTQDADGLANSMAVTIIAFICACIFIGGLTLEWITRSLTKELMGWRKIIRQIPWEIVKNNKVLKNYIENKNNLAFN